MTRRGAEELTLAPLDNRALANLCGPLDANLRQIEAALDVAISHRGPEFTIEGIPPQTARAAEVLQRFYAGAEKPLSVDDIQLGLVEIATRGEPRISPPAAVESDVLPSLRTRRADLHGRTPNQIAYLKAIQAHDITFGIGPAGTGKTYLAVACAVDALERDTVKRIVLVRPAVEAGERLGFLPGDLAQKVDPYLRPLYDALYDLMGFDKAAKLFERNTIELAPLAYMRGRTLNHSFIILDEAQRHRKIALLRYLHPAAQRGAAGQFRYERVEPDIERELGAGDSGGARAAGHCRAEPAPSGLAMSCRS